MADAGAGFVSMVETGVDSVVVVEQVTSQTLFVDAGTGPKGDAGANIELQATSTEIQWRVAGTQVWASLVAFDVLAGVGTAPQLLPGVATTVAYGQAPGVDVVKIAPGQFRLDVTIPAGKPGQPRFSGSGLPPDVIVGAEPGDNYLDTDTGTTYTLT